MLPYSTLWLIIVSHSCNFLYCFVSCVISVSLVNSDLIHSQTIFESFRFHLFVLYDWEAGIVLGFSCPLCVLDLLLVVLLLPGALLASVEHRLQCFLRYETHKTGNHKTILCRKVPFVQLGRQFR